MYAMPAASPLHEDLSRLASALEGLDLRAAAIFADELVAERGRLARAIRSYLIPRLSEADRPMTVVVTGPTGSGKSTLVNSLIGMDLAETGALRPTTRTPLVVTTAPHAERFQGLGGVRCHVATARTPILTRMALVDTPDIDSTSVGHRAMAEALVDSADVVIFVTSALRYADRVPWEVLRRAADRGCPVISVLNRLSAASAGAAIDYGSRLARAGIDTEIVRIPEQRPGSGSARIPAVVVRELSRRLYELADGVEGRPIAMRVATTLLGDVSRLGEALDGLARLVSRRHDQIDSIVISSAAGVELDGIIDDLEAPAPRRGRLRRLLRLRPPALPEPLLASWLEVVAARLSSRVEADLRATARRIDDALPFLIGGAVTEPARVTLATAVHGWLANVRRVTEGMPARDRNAATAQLVRRALGSGDEGRHEALGPREAHLAEAARADLERRLSVAFSQLAVIASAILEARAPAPDASSLDELVVLANARLAFVDA
ncbi:MAG: dynamin family protein [Actinobacteria bacterium]|nr:dynamin family protein [Actinomycetota bacterium]